MYSHLNQDPTHWLGNASIREKLAFLVAIVRGKLIGDDWAF